MVARNLADELGRPESHLALFDGFAAAPAAPPYGAGSRTAAAEALVPPPTWRWPCESPVAAIAGLAAYETQAAAIAATKARRPPPLVRRGRGRHHVLGRARHDGRRPRRLGRGGAGTCWAPTSDEVADAARRAADAWWALLDEREAEGLAVV